jgi:hypothetical protein
MAWPPNVIRVACVITRAANVVRPVANLDRDGAGIPAVIGATAVIGAAAVIRSGAGIGGAIVAFAPSCTERGTE